jgi:hypothetical protein
MRFWLRAEAAAAVSGYQGDKHGADHGETFVTDARAYTTLQRPAQYRQNHKDPWKNNGWIRNSAGDAGDSGR